MQLTHYTDYSLRVLLYLALQEHDQRVTVSEIAERFQIARNHLVKVANRLGQLGYVETLRGKGGGLRLKRPPQAISLGNVIRDMEAKLDIIDCHKPPCPLTPECQLKGILNQAQQAFLQVLDNHTLADLTGQPQQLRQLLSLVQTTA